VTSTVQIAHTNPTPAGTAAVKRLHDLAGGTLVVYPTPGRGGEGIARDILHALGKRFYTRAPRDPPKLEALAALWLRAERTGDDRRPVSEWTLLGDVCGHNGNGLRLTLVVERAVSDSRRAALDADVTELTLDQLPARLTTGRDPARVTDEILDERPV
jgi:hypothetical protein